MIKNIPCTESIEDKVKLLFQVNKSYINICFLIIINNNQLIASYSLFDQHLNNYNDTPTLLSTHQGDEAAVHLTEDKISSCIWDLSGESIQSNEAGDMSIVSTEGHVKVTLLSNKFAFHVEYLQLLPTKQAGYVDAAAASKNQYSSQQFNFHKDFLAKYNLKSSRPSGEQKPQIIRAMHSYIMMKKVHTIFSFPARWTLPLFLLWSRFESSLHAKQQQVTNAPAFSPDFLQFISAESEQLFHNDDNIAFINTIREKYHLSRIPSSNEAVTELPGIDIATTTRNQEAGQITSSSLWLNDDVMPQFEQPRYSGLIAYAWKNAFSFWINNDIEFFAQHDTQQSFIYSTHRGKYFHEVDENRQGCAEKVMNAMHLWNNDAKSKLLVQMVKLLEHSALISSKQTVVDGMKNNIHSSVKQANQPQTALQQFSDNFEIFHSCQNEAGRFDAYQNGCIKVKFADRTILTWKNASQTIDIITRRGDQATVFVASPKEFEGYVAQAVEFQEYCFLDPKEKYQRQQKKQEMQDMIQFEIEKNQRFLTILNGKVPAEHQMSVLEPDAFKQESLMQSINIGGSQQQLNSSYNSGSSSRINDGDDIQAKIQAYNFLMDVMLLLM